MGRCLVVYLLHCIGTYMPSIAAFEIEALSLVSTDPRVDSPQHGEVDQTLTRVLSSLHLTVDHACVLALPGYMVDLGQVAAVRQGGVQDMICTQFGQHSTSAGRDLPK